MFSAVEQLKRTTVRFFLVGAMLAVYLRGQSIDTVIFRGSAGAKRFTIIDQVADVKERRAFLKLYRASDAGKRRILAEAFVKSYPQSWLLAQAYEIAAKACIDLNDYAPALQFGSQSLRLFPENPLLLVPIANVQVQLQQLTKAEEGARATLDYLEWFDRPAAVPAANWPTIQAELKASSYFVLGRVSLAQALRSTGSHKQQKLLQAENFLNQARALNAADPEIAYLLGLTELSLAKPRMAGVFFARARRTRGPLQAKALENLQRIYESYNPKPAGSFEAFLAFAEGDRELDAALGMPPPSVSSQDAGNYAGSQACQPCHAAIYDSWQKTGMARMFRPYRPENVIGDFRTNNQFSDQTGAVVVRMSLNRNKHYFAIRGAAGDWRTYSVDYTIGSKWQQAYATRLPSGDIHVFPVQYSAVGGGWINYWKMIDPPSSTRAEVTAFNQLSAATSYQINCAPCHTSQLRIAKSGSLSGADFEFREVGVNCEMCHGGAQDHVVVMKSGKPAQKSAAATPVDFHNMSARQYVAICGQCHAQSALRPPGPQGEMNYPALDGAFPPVWLSQSYSDVPRRAFYKDGRFRETTFIVEAFRRTACFRRGQAHCGHCHDLHAPESGSNVTSLKFPSDPDRMCLQCHVKFAANISQHTHHPASAEGSGCVACHMPRIMNSVLFKARTHQIDDIPNAEMTARFGNQESPNTCLSCHSEKDLSWVALRLQAW